MSAPKIVPIDQKDTLRNDYFLAPERLISGNPKLTLWELYSDSSGNFSVGVWQGDVGTWTINYKKDEYCEILEGKSVLTNHDGVRVTVIKGERFVIPKGFSGTWQVVEPTKKIYAVHEPKNG